MITRAFESRQVSWWPVHEFVEQVLSAVGSWPMAGTPAWCELAADDPAKAAAVLDAGRRHALHIDVAQAELAEASREIANAADWPAAHRYVTNHKAFYIARPWLKRVVA